MYIIDIIIWIINQYKYQHKLYLLFIKNECLILVLYYDHHNDNHYDLVTVTYSYFNLC